MRIVSKRKTVLKKLLACSVFIVAGIWGIWFSFTFESARKSPDTVLMMKVSAFLFSVLILFVMVQPFLNLFYALIKPVTLEIKDGYLIINDEREIPIRNIVSYHQRYRGMISHIILRMKNGSNLEINVRTALEFVEIRQLDQYIPFKVPEDGEE